MRTIVRDIGEFFTGDIGTPIAPVRALVIEDGVIRALDPPASETANRVVDAAGGLCCIIPARDEGLHLCA